MSYTAGDAASNAAGDATGIAHFRIVAIHSSAQDIVPAPDSNVLKTLFQPTLILHTELGNTNR